MSLTDDEDAACARPEWAGDAAGGDGDLLSDQGAGADDPPPHAAILARLDALALLLAAGGAAAQDGTRLDALDAGLAGLRDAQAARVAETETRLKTRIDMQGQILEALLADSDAADAALIATTGRIEALEALAATRDDRIEMALAACAARLDEALLHLETQAIGSLPGAGRPLRDALRGLSEQLAAIEARLCGQAAPGWPAGPLDDADKAWERTEPASEAAVLDVPSLDDSSDDLRLVLVRALGEGGLGAA